MSPTGANVGNRSPEINSSRADLWNWMPKISSSRADAEHLNEVFSTAELTTKRGNTDMCLKKSRTK